MVRCTPDRGSVHSGNTLDLELTLNFMEPQVVSTQLTVEVRGGKPVKMPIRGEAVLPAIDILEPTLDVGSVYTGVVARVPLTVVNTTPVVAGKPVNVSPREHSLLHPAVMLRQCMLSFHLQVHVALAPCGVAHSHITVFLHQHTHNNGSLSTPLFSCTTLTEVVFCFHMYQLKRIVSMRAVALNQVQSCCHNFDVANTNHLKFADAYPLLFSVCRNGD